jgi:hypothetical protein
MPECRKSISKRTGSRLYKVLIWAIGLTITAGASFISRSPTVAAATGQQKHQDFDLPELYKINPAETGRTGQTAENGTFELQDGWCKSFPFI